MTDHLRVSDAERDRAAVLLRVHLAAGRLTPTSSMAGSPLHWAR